MADLRALLVTGTFGTGKTAVVEEIAEILEAAGEPYAAIDLDWLAWANVDGAGHDDHAILVRNLAAMARNYREAGVRSFLLAGAVETAAKRDAIRMAVTAPLTVVRLTTPLEVIERRLATAPTSGRQDDLARARAWLAAGTGVGLEDAVIENLGPIGETAVNVLDAAGWQVAGAHRADGG